MLSSFERQIRSLVGCRRGNLTILMALGMPALIGAAGLGIDVAQWYLWKRELQFAVDQAAIAGAWAKSQEENGTTYITRATQEYSAAISLTADFDSGPTVTLEDYDGGSDNSIQVVASATRRLPFSSFLTGGAATVSVRAQAIHEPSETYNPCILALDPDARAAVNFHGTVSVRGKCGIGALSDSDDSITFIGNSGTFDLGFVITAGGVSDQHNKVGNAPLIEEASGLQNPYEGLTPPNNPTPRSLSCGSATYTADETVSITTSYAYFTGANRNNLTPYVHPSPKSGTSSSSVAYGAAFTSSPQNSSATSTTYAEVSGNGNQKVWEEKTTTTLKSYSNIASAAAGGSTMQPGTYTSFHVECDTALAAGVYVIDGGLLKIEAQHKLSGAGVMFVLKNGAGLQVAGGAELNLSPMTESQLIATGVPAADAARMVGMLVFEDPNSAGARGNKLTGNSSSVLSGVVYMPNSSLTLTGTSRGTSHCLMIAVKTLEFGGTTNLDSLCPDGVQPTGPVRTKRSVVRLVA